MFYTQDNRHITIDTPLGDNVLLLRGFSGTEGLSIPFSFELDLLSENNITFQDIIGQNVTVSIVLADGERRFFNGIISRFSQYSAAGENDGHGLAHYSSTMVPWFWLLSRTSNSRIFQRLSVPDIVEQIFTEKGFDRFRMNLHDTYDPKEYCVQYRETDFNFVSRLLEQDGIFYFFEHEQRRHTMILADSPDAHRPCPRQESARYHHISAGERLEEDVITSFDMMQEIRIGKYTVNDYNFQMPNTDLKVEASSTQTLGPGERELYDYPAEYSTRTEGEMIANKRMQAEEASITTLTGESTCRAFSSGYRFVLSDYYLDHLNNNPYVLVSVNHGAFEPVGPSVQGGGGASYTNSFTCIPFDVPYRPPLVTPKPMIGGVQTAIVVGPSGEEIYTDEHARVKVQFHWDREGNRDENSSCWVRVSQVSAGSGWGAIDVPRIGHEVIVDFLEGDPDRPIITGRVYHGTNRPPFGLPAGKMVSGMKSNSTPGGGGYNEISMNDTKGEEGLTIHAQYDMSTTVENDKTLTVHNNRTSSIDVDDSETIGNNQTVTIGVDQNETVGSNQTVTIGSDQTINVGTNQTLLVGSNQSQSIGAGRSITVGASDSVTIGADRTLNVSSNINASAGSNVSIKSGANTKISAGAKISVTAGGSIKLTAGGSTIEIGPSGIKVTSGAPVTITGAIVKVNC